MAPRPVGIELCKGGKPKWRIGKKVGSGACATVHILEELDGTSTEWAVKLTPLPKKITKKKNSQEEVNDRLIHYEQLMYQNQFQDVQGTLIPNLPPYRGPPATGEADGYRYLIMEKMDCQLSDLSSLLLGQSRSAKTVSFAPIAKQLLTCVQAIQERKHVVIDIKPENFMLTHGKGKGPSLPQQLASRIRILDLALVQPWASIGSHRTNDGTKGVAGTPLYASLNVHNGETPSRRDDLESLGYVIAEIIMQLASGDDSKELPWSHGQSDEEIGELKEEQISDPKSDFYKSLGGAAVVKIFKEYMDEVQGYSFKKTPDYESLATILSKLKVPLPSSQKATAPPRKAATTKRKSATAAPRAAASSGTKRSTRSQTTRVAAEESPAEESPNKMARGTSYMEAETIDDSDEDSWTDAQPDIVIIDHDEEDDDGDSFATAMDWETIPDENQEPVSDSKPKALIGVSIVVEAGPHKGKARNLIKGQSESIVVGRNPTTSPGEVAWKLPDDEDIDNSHLRLDLGVTKKLISVVATDLKSTNGSFVGSEKIRKGKDYRVFRGGSLRIGSSVLSIKTLDPKKVASNSQQSRSPTAKQASRKQHAHPAADEPEEELTAKEVPRLKRRGVKLVVAEGPHKGESFELEHGGVESFNVGSKPSAKTGDMLSLKKDGSLKANHVRLDLVIAKKLTTITVTDKSKGGTCVNRDVVNKGRAFINDRIKIGNSVLEIQAL